MIPNTLQLLLLVLVASFGAAASPLPAPATEHYLVRTVQRSFIEKINSKMARAVVTREGGHLIERAACPDLTCATGTIAVFLKKGAHKSLGLVAKYFAAEGPVYTVTTSPNHSTPLVVTLPSTKFSVLSSVFNIATRNNGPDPAHPFLGAALIVDPLKKGAAGYAFLSGTVAGKVGKASLSTSKVPSLGESKIWKLDCHTQHFSIDWVNNDSKHFPATFFFFPRDNILTKDEDGVGIYGDRAQVESVNDVRLQDVNLKFIPAKPCPQVCV